MPPTIDLLLRLVPDSTSHASILNHIDAQPSLASTGDAHGYTLLHAASSYSHTSLLRELITNRGVSPNITDEDGDTPLFYAENVGTARCLVELGADVRWRNNDGVDALANAEESFEGEEAVALTTFLQSLLESGDEASSTRTTDQAASAAQSSISDGVHPPPPLPDGVKINVGTMVEDEAETPDPEFKRRIDELAAREDFQSEEGQKQLRELITEAVRGVANDQQGGRDVRRRIE